MATQISKTQSTLRARSDDQKRARRTEILQAAHQAVIEQGYEQLTMAGLAKSLGLAKGTLYLYFATREELFLALYHQILVCWCDDVMAEIARGNEIDELPDILIKISQQTPLFLELGAKVTSVLETNVSTQSLILAKRQTMDIAARYSGELEQVFDLQPGQGEQLAAASFAILLGAAQMDGHALLEQHELDEDIVDFIQMSRFENVVKQSMDLVISAISPNKAG